MVGGSVTTMFSPVAQSKYAAVYAYEKPLKSYCYFFAKTKMEVFSSMIKFGSINYCQRGVGTPTVSINIQWLPS